MYRNRRRRSSELKFNLSKERAGGSNKGSLFILIVGTGLFCGALLFAFGKMKHLDPKVPTEVGGSLSAGKVDPTGGESGGLAVSTQDGEGYRGVFSKCGRVRTTCVVDGDTFWLEGKKIRIADVDTPEISQPRCREEYVRGLAATQRLIELLNQGSFFLAQTGWGDEDRFGRKPRIVYRNGASIGTQLINEGLAHPWDGHKRSWCGP